MFTLDDKFVVGPPNFALSSGKVPKSCPHVNSVYITMSRPLFRYPSNDDENTTIKTQPKILLNLTTKLPRSGTRPTSYRIGPPT
ncbi:hypothetical protein BLOT_009814 [Blomia tropicalis]|nr:hypothetical protein BLOT_009814 [Blomia tropicalis]